MDEMNLLVFRILVLQMYRHAPPAWGCLRWNINDVETHEV